MSQSIPRFTIAGLPFGFEDNDLEAFAEHLDELSLDSELGELLHESLELVDEGLSSFSPDRTEVIGLVVRRHHNIARMVVDRGASIHYAIRFIVEGCGSLRDSELVCAYAIAKATRGLKRLADWINAIEQDLIGEDDVEFVEGRRARLLEAKADEPEIYYRVIDDLRRQWPLREIEARESCVRFLGEARHALLLSSVYDDLDETRQVVESQRVERRKASAEGGKKGLKNQEWAYHFINQNLAWLAYGGDGVKLSRKKLVELLLERILPNELEKQNPGDKPRIPSEKTLYGNGPKYPGWLIKLGFNELPEKQPY